MTERVLQFRVGVMVLATVLIAATLLAMFGGVSSLFEKSYTIHIRLSEAPGVSIGTPVRKSGIRIGRVTQVEFNENDHVLVTAKIDRQFVLHNDETCFLRSSLLGDATLDFEHVRKTDPSSSGSVGQVEKPPSAAPPANSSL